MSNVVMEKKGKEGNYWVRLTDEVDEKVVGEMGKVIIIVPGRGRSPSYKAVGPFNGDIKGWIKAINLSSEISSKARKLREAADKARAAEKKKK